MHFIFGYVYNIINTFHIDTHSYGDQICVLCLADSFDGICCFKNKLEASINIAKFRNMSILCVFSWWPLFVKAL